MKSNEVLTYHPTTESYVGLVTEKVLKLQISK